MYAYMNPEHVFGSFGAAGDWWEALDDDAKFVIQNWIVESFRAYGTPLNVSDLTAQARTALRDAGIESGRISATMISDWILRRILGGAARPVVDGGGFFVHEPARGINHFMCPATSPGTTTRMVDDARCPDGTGGVPVAVQVGVKMIGRTASGKKSAGSDATTATVRGRVVDASGAGITGATVNIGPPGGGLARPGMMTSVVSGTDGSFSADVVPSTSNTVNVTVEAAGYVGATASGVEAQKGQTTDGVVVPLVAVSPSDYSSLCPDGFVLAPDGTSCVALGKKNVEAAKPWYKRTSTWLITGVVLVAGGVILKVGRK